MKVGILGGGQLAQMLAQAGIPLGMEFMFLCPSPDACAASLGRHLCLPFDDGNALQQLSDWSDVITFEFENVPAEAVRTLTEHGRVHPSARVLATAQDRLREKRLFHQLDIPTPGFAPVDSLEDLRQAVARLGLPAVLKTRRGGYDGKGQAVLRSEQELAEAWNGLGGVPMVLEAFVPLQRELSIVAVRNETGETRFYPASENYHREGILRLSLSSIDDPLQTRAEEYMGRLLRELDQVGTLALDVIQTEQGLLANEIAPRVHNTGHWTIEGAHCSQFENHLRAVCALPLGDTGLARPAAMVNIIGTLPDLAAVAEIPATTQHIYGKAEREGRKLGHVTLTSDSDGFDAEFRSRLVRLLRIVGEQDLARAMEQRAD